jgi:hypothetical protein
MLIVCALLAARYVQCQYLAAASKSQAQRAAEQVAVAQMLRRSTPADAVIAVPENGAYYLLTDRRAVPFVASEDPVGMNYPPDRPARYLGLGTTRGALAAYQQMLERKYFTYCRTAGVTHVAVLKSEQGLGGVFDAWRKAQSDHFVPIDQTEKFRLYAFQP